MLIVGNPNFDKSKFNLQDLSYAEKEARKIAKYYENPELLIGKAATKEVFLEKSKKAGITHFAGHYVVENCFSLKSGLVMAKEKVNQINF